MLNTRGPNESFGSLCLGVWWSLTGFALVIVTLRVYTACCIRRHVAIDDYFIVASLVCNIIGVGFLTAAVLYGLGSLIKYLSDEQMTDAENFVNFSVPPTILGAALGRISFSIYLLRFVAAQPLPRYLIYILIVSQAIVNGVLIILSIILCSSDPNELRDGGSPLLCRDILVIRDVGLVQAIWNSLTDLCLTVLPAAIVWNTHLARREKIGISALLGLSILALSASIVRTCMVNILLDADLFEHLFKLHLWVIVEACIIIIGASIPTLSPLYKARRRAANSKTPGPRLYKIPKLRTYQSLQNQQSIVRS